MLKLAFLQFMHGAMGAFCDGRSLFAGRWRTLPIVEGVARQIGTNAFADQVARMQVHQ